MRINCAHDDAAAWARMIEHLRRANRALGRSCQVAMDLGGPKLRTGPLRAGPAVVRVRPERDVFGRVTSAARLWLAPSRGGRAAPSAADATLPLPPDWLHRRKVGEALRFTDARGACRELKVADVTVDGVWAESRQTCYIVPGTTLQPVGAKGKGSTGVVGAFPAAREEPIVLHAGDSLVITRSLEPGRAATHDDDGRVLTPAVYWLHAA